MKFRIVLAGVCAGTLGLTGCGGSGDGARPAAKGSPDAVAAVKAAAQRTVDAGSSRTRTTMTMESGGRTVVLTGEGLFDYRRRIGTVSLQVPKDSGITGPLQEIVTPEALYMKNATPGVPADKWVRIDVQGLADGNLLSGGSADPSTSFEILRGVNDDVVLVGPVKLGGEDVKHYKGTLDLKKAHDATPQHLRAPLAAALKSFASTTIPFEVYLDGQGRLRKVQEEFNLAAGGQAQAGKGADPQTARVVSAAELYEFGVSVDVQAPRPEDLYIAPAASASPPASRKP
ncbi:hypothetical protein [Yinghuangia soli]|uniref:Lipoprotein n=1 Tax=Yinghuangia soli TaxID=2908204 RepID=A0AA41U279_9ACTN|nr:hypothetical protein [Yinghuangia soli]MCF2526844.1 hypothetical protein [Yinghuangia soli]